MIDSDCPEDLNLKEVLSYYGLEGRLGKYRYYSMFFGNWIFQTLAKLSPHPKVTAGLHRMRGVNIGRHVYIGAGVQLDEIYPHLITIEDYVSIGMRTMIFAHSNPTCSIYLKRNYYPRYVKPVVIKRGAWIAPGCIILAGVTIGENSIVGAGSLVVKDVEPNTVVGGSPAKMIKRLQPPG